MNYATLSSLKCGDEATVKYMDQNANLYNRLQELGVIEGTKIKKVLVSPLGDPSAYYIRGAVIAIRNCDAESILIGGDVRHD